MFPLLKRRVMNSNLILGNLSLLESGYWYNIRMKID